MSEPLLVAALFAAAGCPALVAAAPAEAPAIVRFAAAGDARSVVALLTQGADPDARLPGGRTALMEAAELGRYDIVRELMVRGARKDLVDGQGRTAFDLAAARNHSDIVALLRDAS